MRQQERKSRIPILLSLNAVAILIAGVLIASAIGLTGNGTVAVVAERSDIIDEAMEMADLIAPALQVQEEVVSATEASNNTAVWSGTNLTGAQWTSGGNVGPHELWGYDTLTIYASADQDICVDESLTGLGEMYWQTSNPAVIASFYGEARTYLGYSSDQCRFPKIVGTGTTVVTAGTYDGMRRDELTVNVIAVPEAEWKQQVLQLVNAERARAGVGALSWGSTCEVAAQTRAYEIMSVYAHSRPDGSEWYTTCPIPASGGKSGENVAAGSAVVSPETVVLAWMNSDEHRRNILDGDFTRLAVGFVYDGGSRYKTYWSQIFTNY